MPCTDLHGMSLVVVVFLGEELILYAELFGVAGLRVFLVGMWKHHCTQR